MPKKSNVRKLPSGNWQWRVVHPTTGERLSGTKSTATEAHRAADVALAAARTGTYVDPKAKHTVNDAMAAYLRRKELDTEASSLSRSESDLRLHVAPRIGSTRVTTIERRDIEAMLRDVPLAPDTKRRLLAVTKAMFGQCVDDGWLLVSPAAKVSLGKRKQTEKRFLSVPELMSLIDAMPTDTDRVFVAFLGASGARWGEASSMKIGDLNIGANQVTLIRESKTRSSRRTITIPSTVMGQIVELIGDRTSGLVFTSPEGAKIHASNWSRRVWHSAVSASVGDPMRPHDVRHTHAALCILDGMHALSLSKRLGHASIQITMDTYGHLFPEIDAGIGSRLDAMLYGHAVGTDPDVIDLAERRKAV